MRKFVFVLALCLFVPALALAQSQPVDQPVAPAQVANQPAAPAQVANQPVAPVQKNATAKVAKKRVARKPRVLKSRPKVSACQWWDFSCQRQAKQEAESSQDQTIKRLEKKLNSLHSQKRQLAEVEKTVNKILDDPNTGIVKRITALEKAKDGLPKDLIGKGDIEKLISEAQTNSGGAAAKVKSDMDDVFGRRNTEVDGAIAVVNRSLTDLRTRVTKLEKRQIHMDLGSFFSLHEVGYETGGSLHVILPLGKMTGTWLRLGGGLGWSDESGKVGWLGQASLRWTLDDKSRWQFGLTGLVTAATDSRGNHDLVPAGGVCLRWEPWSWLYLEMTPYMGAALTAPSDKEFTWGGLMEVGFPIF